MDSHFSLTFLKHRTNSNARQIKATFITPNPMLRWKHFPAASSGSQWCDTSTTQRTTWLNITHQVLLCGSHTAIQSPCTPPCWLSTQHLLWCERVLTHNLQPVYARVCWSQMNGIEKNVHSIFYSFHSLLLFVFFFKRPLRRSPSTINFRLCKTLLCLLICYWIITVEVLSELMICYVYA